MASSKKTKKGVKEREKTKPASGWGDTCEGARKKRTRFSVKIWAAIFAERGSGKSQRRDLRLIRGRTFPKREVGEETARY